MSQIQISSALFAAAVGLITLVPKAGADAWDKKTIVTISGPMEVPGVTLEPGTYVFKLVDSTDRHIVMIQNERQNKTFATILAIPNYRLQPTGKSQFLFWETPAGQPQALRAWFYPADNFGQEFVYPKGKFRQVAQVKTQDTAASPVAQAAPAPPQAAPPQPEVAQSTPPPPPAEPPVIAQNDAPAPPEPAPAPPAVETNTRRTLPQTAGSIPLLALAGFLSVGFALGLSAFAKRMG